ncbi:MAG: ThuA domain-containing protein, partial [Planctomycetia bacterium]|nr:ThuA domain-containing protein [Planctomycetia bacterium]
MKRRDLLRMSGAAFLGGLATTAFPDRFVRAADGKKQKVLYFTRSNGFVHSVVARKDGELAYSEKIMIEEGKKYGVEVVCTKDGSVF